MAMQASIAPTTEPTTIPAIALSESPEFWSCIAGSDAEGGELVVGNESVEVVVVGLDGRVLELGVASGITEGS
jgi:hypothetical protein